MAAPCSAVISYIKNQEGRVYFAAPSPSVRISRASFLDSPVVVNAGDGHDGVNDPEIYDRCHRHRDAVFAENLRTRTHHLTTSKRWWIVDVGWQKMERMLKNMVNKYILHFVVVSQHRPIEALSHIYFSG